MEAPNCNWCRWLSGKVYLRPDKHDPKVNNIVANCHFPGRPRTWPIDAAFRKCTNYEPSFATKLIRLTGFRKPIPKPIEAGSEKVKAPWGTSKEQRK